MEHIIEHEDLSDAYDCCIESAVQSAVQEVQKEMWSNGIKEEK